ncbi:hypothetical protein KIN20_008009 [Parelaphostrongylus tenuis]|uniref:Uncharacterized protein n=1 Tax=Parelaphostrongylus tenuis TaxID=148309 RepID=A0AAD5QJJ0_PARTN|nr:hypothetical protein KIN20_008009 [Parelaphostrongylus tenuis]
MSAGCDVSSDDSLSSQQSNDQFDLTATTAPTHCAIPPIPSTIMIPTKSPAKPLRRAEKCSSSSSSSISRRPPASFIHGMGG